MPQDSPLNEVEIFLIKEVRVLVPQDPLLYEVEMFFLLIRKTSRFEEMFLIWRVLLLTNAGGGRGPGN